MSLFHRPVVLPEERPKLIQAIRSMPFIDIRQGPWIAGGAALAVAMERPDLDDGGDIDIFCANQHQFDTARNWFMSEVGKEIRARKKPLLNVFGFGAAKSDFDPDEEEYERRVKDLQDFTKIDYYLKGEDGEKSTHFVVQIIKREFFHDLGKLLDDFDITVAQFATDGQTVYGTTEGWEALAEGRLEVTSRVRKTLWRMGKYCKTGFTPPPGVLYKVAKKCIQEDNYCSNSGIASTDNDY